MDTRKMRPILESFHYPILDFLVLVIMMTSQLQKSFIEKYDLLHDGQRVSHRQPVSAISAPPNVV